MLVNTGSTHNFINMETAEKLQCSLTVIKPLLVEVVYGAQWHVPLYTGWGHENKQPLQGWGHHRSVVGDCSLVYPQGSQAAAAVRLHGGAVAIQRWQMPSEVLTESTYLHDYLRECFLKPWDKCSRGSWEMIFIQNNKRWKMTDTANSPWMKWWERQGEIPTSIWPIVSHIINLSSIINE